MSVSEDRTQRLLAIMLLQTMKGASQKEKAIQLSLAGFSNVEIADLLQTSSQVIAQQLYKSQRKRPRRKK